jgi:hypothetical protein
LTWPYVAESNIRRFYRREEFTALNGPIPLDLLSTVLNDLTLSVPIADMRITTAGGLGLEWAEFPSADDIEAIDAAIAAFTGGTTTSTLAVQSNNGPVTASTSTPVDVVDFTTPPLAGGKYQVIWNSMFRLTAVAASTGARAIVTVAGVTQQSHWGESLVTAYNGAATFERLAGQTIRVQLQIAKVGAGAVNAEMTGARFSIDKIG